MSYDESDHGGFGRLLVGQPAMQFFLITLPESTMHKMVKALALAAGLMALQTGLAHADLKIGFAAEPFPPFSSKDASGKWVGWEVEAIEAVCKAMNEKCDYVEVAWDGIIPALQAKTIDVIWSAMVINAKRREVIDFSDSYYRTTLFIVGAKNGDLDVSPEHLAGKTIGVQVSTVSSKYADEKFKPAGVEIKTYSTQDEVTQDIAAGRLDYAIGSAAVMTGFVKSEAGLACCEYKANVDDPSVVGEGIGAGIRKGDKDLKVKLDTAIKDVAKSGEFDRITAGYPDLKDVIATPKP
jgi:polar amino acid transport system substrate-binding protein